MRRPCRLIAGNNIICHGTCVARKSSHPSAAVAGLVTTEPCTRYKAASWTAERECVRARVRACVRMYVCTDAVGALQPGQVTCHIIQLGLHVRRELVVHILRKVLLEEG